MGAKEAWIWYTKIKTIKNIFFKEYQKEDLIYYFQMGYRSLIFADVSFLFQ